MVSYKIVSKNLIENLREYIICNVFCGFCLIDFVIKKKFLEFNLNKICKESNVFFWITTIVWLKNL